tara:strand:+ start:978 stop:1418 length:441 start_codon:yes stop_codon:yes gene_type:complete
MKLRLPSVFFITICSVMIGFSQDNMLEGNWMLDAIELREFTDSDLSFAKEESFFGYYLNRSEVLAIQDQRFPVVIGGDLINYNYELKGSNLILKNSNTVMVSKDGKKETISKSGESEFKIKVTKKTMIISRRNQTFFESYTFSKIN